MSLEKYANIWHNISMTSNDFEKIGGRQFQRRGEIEDLGFLKNQDNPIFISWIYWLFIIVVLFFLIAAMLFLNCFCLKKTIKKHSKKSGLVIEYPEGYASLYENVVLNLNRGGPVNNQFAVSIQAENDIISYEDQVRFNKLFVWREDWYEMNW